MLVRPHRLLPNVERFEALTPTLAPATHTNSYALGGREVVLVEPATPYADEQREWLAWARGLRTEGRRLLALVLTHHHPDHVGGTEVFARELGISVWAHEATAERVDVPVERRLVEGETFVLEGPSPMSVQVLHTPGHAPGHVCLRDKAGGALVVGDMVASLGTILIAPGDGDMAEYMTQLDRLSQLTTSWVLPAHGQPIDGASGVFVRTLEHRRQRERKVVHAVRAQGRRGALLDELLPAVYDDVGSAVWPIALLSLESHLTKLESEGEVVRHEGRWCSLRT